MNYSMSDNTKLEVAIEILSEKIASLSSKGLSTESNEMKELLSEREKLYLGDTQIIDKIINVYGPEIKNKYDVGDN